MYLNIQLVQIKRPDPDLQWVEVDLRPSSGIFSRKKPMTIFLLINLLTQEQNYKRLVGSTAPPVYIRNYVWTQKNVITY